MAFFFFLSWEKKKDCWVISEYTHYFFSVKLARTVSRLWPPVPLTVCDREVAQTRVQRVGADPFLNTVQCLLHSGWSTWYLNISGAIRWERAAHELFSSKLNGTEGQKTTTCLIPILSQSPHCWILVKGDWSRGYTVQRSYWLAKAARQWDDPPHTHVSQWRDPRLCLSKFPSRYTVWIWRSLLKSRNRDVFIECSGSVDMPSENRVILATWVITI